MITADDIYVEEEETENPSKPKSGMESAVSRSKSRFEDKGSAAKPKPRSEGTPKKRVISDEHWKLKRSPPRTTSTKTPAPKPKRITVYKTNDDIISSQPGKREPKADENFKPLAPYRPLNDATKVYRTAPVARGQPKYAKSVKDDDPITESRTEEEGGPSVDKTPPSTAHSAASTRRRQERQPGDAKDAGQTTSPPKDDDDWAKSEADFSELSRRRARRSYHGSQGNVKIPKGGIFSHMLDESKKMFGKPEPPSPRPNRGQKIEAWLEATPDPFVDEDHASVEIPAPLKTRSNRSDISREQEALSDHDARSELTVESGSHRKNSPSVTSKRVNDDAKSTRDTLSTLSEEPTEYESASHRKKSPSVTSKRSKPPTDDGHSTISGDAKSFRDTLSTLSEEPSEYESSSHRKKSPSVTSRRLSEDDRSTICGDAKSVRDTLSTVSEEPAEYKDQKQESSSLKRTAMHRRAKSTPVIQKDYPPHKEQPEEASETEMPPFSDGSEVSASDAPVPLNLRRPFPSTGVHRLSTIASVSTEGTRDEEKSQKAEPEENTSKNQEPPPSVPDDASLHSEARDQFDPDSLSTPSCGLKRRLTTHEDLISVLSAPNTRSRSIRSARSVRSNRNRSATTVDELLQELASDEVKYMRELKTLVGGVIPVLLTCVLSKSDSAIAAGLFRPSLDPKDDLNFTRPIVDMGVALERLKTLHKRIPLNNPDALLTWALGAQRVYREYLRAWRLGFQDVVVNLAPAEEGEEQPTSETRSLDEGMARDENGDIVDGDGEKVDVAYLLKRPLVRLKYLAKTFKGINALRPSLKAEDVAATYQSLVGDARRRSHEERARLEDDAANRIDPTRARDPRTLAVLRDVTIDQTRRVRARDFFELSLYHSSGQMVDCRAELLLRDNAPENGTGGDLLVCEVDNSDRWLLFPPIEVACVSARNGDVRGEIVVMIRSEPGQERTWQELLSLKIDDEEVGFEWVHMLGLYPIPPAICRTKSFINRTKENQPQRTEETTPTEPSRHTPTSSEIDVPMGEKATDVSHGGKRRSISPREHTSAPSTLSSSSAARSRASLYSSITRESDYGAGEPVSPPRSAQQPQPSSTPRSLDETIVSPEGKSSTGLKRSKAKRISRYGENSPSSPLSRASQTPERDLKSPTSTLRSERGGDETRRSVKSPEPIPNTRAESPRDRSPPGTASDGESERRHQRVSSVPSMDLPTIRKIRKTTGSSKAESVSSQSSAEPELPDSPKSPEQESPREASLYTEDVPPPPPHRVPTPAHLKTLNAPVLAPSGMRLKRRTSSPLKHEYEPSSASDSEVYSESETSTVRHYEIYSSSSETESSEEESESDGELEDDIPRPLPPVQPQSQSYQNPSPPASPEPASDTPAPANQESQEAHHEAAAPQPPKVEKAIASVFTWSDTGVWESLHPEECTIIVTPGLIEAYEMGAAPHASEDTHPGASGERPLIALELTPLVPIRRGTAIDITIRSPPTERSKVTVSSNVMFRSRNMEECEALYAMINHSRINNPTYIALQNAQVPYSAEPPSLGNLNSTGSNKTGSWFRWPRRRNSYRARGAAARSTAEASESSVGTMSSAFSALKKFGAGNMFNIARSTILSRTGSRGDSLYSSSAGSGPSPNSRLDALAAAVKSADGIGLSNAKIRLYVRETASKWRDMGPARLTIMPVTTPSPSRPDTAVDGSGDPSNPTETTEGARRLSTSASPTHYAQDEKRILIRGKTRGEVLLDVCLGETAFERVARTGIAVSVWEEHEGGAIAKQGGVMGGSFRVYMIQMKSEAEAAYTFGLVGKLRY